ncbi:helix-turn-helix transcriptional regulator [Streptomyces sp. TRM68367]|uniref:ArsR/SmtB family transcription factor n=1 Tax=Streptomyces sp. TRM68367 TaxID=2758415 RepID=UPI00165A9E55|nr:helix-turn-helix domain-containing protein [Streptomyces sp. TRM68367]MBC9727794.1 helix-turn-helix domain-containing protein [Streptomyces sp. TRM68367]
MLRTPVDETRLRILAWLKEPGPAEHGATVGMVAEHFALRLPVAETHLRLLAAVGLLRTSTHAGRVRYRRDEMRIAEVARLFEKGW